MTKLPKELRLTAKEERIITSINSVAYKEIIAPLYKNQSHELNTIPLWYVTKMITIDFVHNKTTEILEASNDLAKARTDVKISDLVPSQHGYNRVLPENLEEYENMRKQHNREMQDAKNKQEAFVQNRLQKDYPTIAEKLHKIAEYKEAIYVAKLTAKYAKAREKQAQKAKIKEQKQTTKAHEQKAQHIQEQLQIQQSLFNDADIA